MTKVIRLKAEALRRKMQLDFDSEHIKDLLDLSKEFPDRAMLIPLCNDNALVRSEGGEGDEGQDDVVGRDEYKPKDSIIVTGSIMELSVDERVDLPPYGLSVGVCLGAGYDHIFDRVSKYFRCLTRCVEEDKDASGLIVRKPGLVTRLATVNKVLQEINRSVEDSRIEMDAKGSSPDPTKLAPNLERLVTTFPEHVLPKNHCNLNNQNKRVLTVVEATRVRFVQVCFEEETWGDLRRRLGYPSNVLFFDQDWQEINHNDPINTFTVLVIKNPETDVLYAIKHGDGGLMGVVEAIGKTVQAGTLHSKMQLDLDAYNVRQWMPMDVRVLYPLCREDQ